MPSTKLSVYSVYKQETPKLTCFELTSDFQVRLFAPPSSRWRRQPSFTPLGSKVLFVPGQYINIYITVAAVFQLFLQLFFSCFFSCFLSCFSAVSSAAFLLFLQLLFINFFSCFSAVSSAAFLLFLQLLFISVVLLILRTVKTLFSFFLSALSVILTAVLPVFYISSLIKFIFLIHVETNYCHNYLKIAAII